MTFDTARRVSVTLLFLALLIPGTALAYGGPGSIVSGIGALLATVAAIGAAVLGFFWFPAKRVLRSIRGEDEERDTRPPDVGDSLPGA